MRPGGGFLFVFAAVIGAAAFFAWGLRTPELERVWRMQLELALGKRKPLSGEERALLAGALARHAELADAFLDTRDAGIISANHDGLFENGYAYVVRRAATPRRAIELVATDVHGEQPIEVEVRAGKKQERGTVGAGAPFTFVFGDEGPFPQLIEVRVHGKKDRHALVLRLKELP